MPCRYEDLKQQLLAAQNLAEQEGDQQELARAAAAVARLTFPSGNVEPRTPVKLTTSAQCPTCLCSTIYMGTIWIGGHRFINVSHCLLACSQLVENHYEIGMSWLQQVFGISMSCSLSCMHDTGGCCF